MADALGLDGRGRLLDLRAPHLLGDRIASFEADLRDLLMRSSPSGLYSARLSDNTIDT